MSKTKMTASDTVPTCFFYKLYIQMKTIHTKKIIYTDTMKIFFFFHSKTEADQKNVSIYETMYHFIFLQLPSPLSFEREASLFVQINQYKNNKSYIMEQNGDPGFCGTRSS